MKGKRTGILAALTAAVLLTALVAADERLTASANEAALQQQTAYELRQTMLRQTEAAAICVTEDGVSVGTYTLEQLGLLQAAQEAVSVQFWPQEALPPEDFARLSLWEKLQWYGVPHVQTPQVDVEEALLQSDCVWADLQAMPRREAKDAYAYFHDGVFLTQPEESGTILLEEPVEQALLDAAASLVIGAEQAAVATVELTDYPCYVPPTVTADNADFDYPALLRQELQGKQLQLQLVDRTEVLDTAALAQLLTVDDAGVVSAAEQPLQALAAAWAQDTDKERTPFMFRSHVQGYIPISFLKVDYTLDQQALCRLLGEQLPRLDMTPITAPVSCRRYKGDPFTMGDTYVEVDIDNQVMTFFKDGELVVSTDVVTGYPDGNMTPRGYYNIYNKDTDCWLIGADYCVFVEYWVGVEDVYGIHDASWRTKFGGRLYKTNGSHGCVNTPTEAMKTLFEAIEVGTPTLIY